MSKRKDLLEVALSEEKNVSVVIAATLVKDLKFLKRAIRDLEDEIEDAGEILKTRLSSNVVIDTATVVVTFGKITQLEEELLLYKTFERVYFPTEK
jgi:hypothetical protein